MLDTQPHTRLENQPTGTWRRLATAPQPRSACWVVAQTHPQAERWAAAELHRRGYRTYLPLLAVLRRDRATHRMMHTVHVPLFPGYLFVNLAPTDPWSPVKHAPGIAALLMACGCPEQVRNGLVETLQAGDDARRAIAPPAAAWEPGAACRLTSGPFDGHDAVVIAADRTIRVGVMCFGALREVDVPHDWIEAR